MSQLNDLKEYSALLLKRWILWVFLGMDLIAFLLVYSYREFDVPFYVYGILPVIGIFLASFEIYLDMKNSIRSHPFYSRRAAFTRIMSSMPKLIQEMQDDLSRPGKENVREFYAKEKSWVVNYAGPAFIYHYEEHENLDAALQVLNNSGFIEEIPRAKHLKWYRMTEEFVSLLRHET